MVGSSVLQQSFLIKHPIPQTQSAGPLVLLVSDGSCYSKIIAFSEVSKAGLTPVHFSVTYGALGRCIANNFFAYVASPNFVVLSNFA